MSFNLRSHFNKAVKRFSPGFKLFQIVLFRVNVSSDKSIVGVNLENLVDKSSFVRRKNKARFGFGSVWIKPLLFEMSAMKNKGDVMRCHKTATRVLIKFQLKMPGVVIARNSENMRNI